MTSWTVSFKNDITGERLEGTIALEVWSATAAECSDFTRKLQSKLADPASFRQQGFGILHPAGSIPAEGVSYQPVTGSAFPVWRQQLTYTFHFDSEQGGEASSGGPIQKINLNLPAEEEAFAVPPGS